MAPWCMHIHTSFGVVFGGFGFQTAAARSTVHPHADLIAQYAPGAVRNVF